MRTKIETVEGHDVFLEDDGSITSWPKVASPQTAADHCSETKTFRVYTPTLRAPGSGCDQIVSSDS